MTTNEIKQQIDKVFSERYEYINECAYNVLKKVNRTDLSTELVTNAYLYLTKDVSKFKAMALEGKLEGVVVRFMTMQIVWGNTEFKKQHIYRNEKINSNVLVGDLRIDSEDLDINELLDEELELKNRVSCVETYIKTRDITTQVLYKTVFEDGINTSGKLSKHIGINRTSCYYLIKNLKEDIRNNCK